jgi:hypothetical protein
MIGKRDSGVGGHSPYDAGFFPAEWVIATGAIETYARAKGDGGTGIAATDWLTDKSDG